MTTDLTDLLARVEAAGPDRELDADLWWVLRHPDAERCFNNGATGLPRDYPPTLPIPAGMGRAGVRAMAPAFTASLDAALALCERVLPESPVIIGARQTPATVPWARVGVPQNGADSTAPTPALALLAAMLKALGPGDGTGGDPSPRKESA